MTLTRRLTAIALMVALGGCTVGPDFSEPSSEVPDAFAAEEATGTQQETGLAPPTPNLAWWRRFGDPVLTRLIREAVKANTDLQEARARVLEARALRRAAGAEGRPRLGTSGQARTFAISENGPGATGTFIEQGLADRSDSLLTGTFSASWEPDIFGETRRRVEAATARTGAAVNDRRGVRLTVIADVARAYMELRGAQRRLATAKDNIAIQKETLQLVRNRFESGLVPELDVAQARRRLAQTKARVPPQRAAIRVNAHALGRLLGRPPTAVLDRLEARKALPDTPPRVPVGLPADLLGRRPDLRAARNALHAATAEVGVAVAQLYPDISLTGAVGLESDSFADLVTRSSGLWSLGSGVSWPIFQGGRLRANIDAAEARVREAESRYRGAVLEALEDVENALVRYAESRNETERLREAVAASRDALRQAQVLYERGLTAFIDVLEAQRALTELEDRLAAKETATVVNLIAVYKALGGGWAAGGSTGAGPQRVDAG